MSPSQYASHGTRKPARLIVWERDGSWARQLRRLLGPIGPRLYEARTSGACREMMAENPASVVVAELTTGTSKELSQFVTRTRCDFPRTRLLAVADAIAEPFRWQILELGFVWLCTSPRQLQPVVEIIQCHFDVVFELPRTLEQRIWDELPWSSTPI